MNQKKEKNMKFIILIFAYLSTCVAYGQWQQEGNIILGGNGSEGFGWSTSLNRDGTIVSVGIRYSDGNGNNSGGVKIYEKINEVWTQVGNSIFGEASMDESGYSIALNDVGNIIAIGALKNDNNNFDAGHVRVYENINGAWTQIGNDIDGVFFQESSGIVSINGAGNIVAIGAPNSAGLDGRAKIYENVSGQWVQIGTDFVGEITDHLFGVSVSLNRNGNIVAIGGSGFSGTHRGYASVFENINGTWVKIGSNILGAQEEDNFGIDVSLNEAGTILAVGANYGGQLNGTDPGHVRIYENINGMWTQIGNDIDGEASFDLFGNTVALNGDGTIVAIGANNQDGNGNDSGSVYVYKNMSGTWTLIDQNIYGEESSNSGQDVSINSNGDTIVIAANGYDDAMGNSNIGAVRVYSNPSLLSLKQFDDNLVTMYPNPVKDHLKIISNSIITNISIKDINGRLLKDVTVNSVTFNADLSYLPIGMYFLEIQSGKSKEIKKIIKN